MAGRDMFKIIEKTKMNPLYEMNSAEVQELYRYIAWHREFEAIMFAFEYGYALGQRALKAELRKEIKKP